MNRGSFVRGGIQHSALENKDPVQQPLADQRKSGKDVKPLQQYKTQSKPVEDAKNTEYEKKLAEAGELMTIKSTEHIVQAALQRQRDKRDRLRDEARREREWRDRERYSTFKSVSYAC